ncbi:Ig-like domain-containing protein, partial [Ligilactobacillus hayakitensis]|uniref:Ig-like domain-containing protein n=1 Tax=Ligilactobacillus hayakitensis TaxID=396716 RepID=UPI00177CD190
STVEVKDKDGNVIGTTTADENGNFTVEVPADKTADLAVTAQEAGKKASDPVKATDKTGLEKAINDGNDAQAGDNYKNAAEADKKALDDALANGETVKNDPNATQDQVDAAQKAIEDAIKNINDKANQA